MRLPGCSAAQYLASRPSGLTGPTLVAERLESARLEERHVFELIADERLGQGRIGGFMD